MKRAFTIYYDESSMELVKVEIGKDFAAAHAIAKADVLKDCYEYFAETYNATLMEEGWEARI